MPRPALESDELRSAGRAARAEAAAWIVRLHGRHRSPNLEVGFRKWLAESSENRRQFERVTEVWEAGATVPIAGIPRSARWKAPGETRRWAVAAAMVLLIGLGSILAYHYRSLSLYSTEIGEQRIVRLDDGTRLSLNSATTVSLSYSKNERRITLEKGEAYFEVAHDSTRPFVVTAGDRQVTALGTAFMVRYDLNRTAVILIDGRVAVQSGSTVPAYGADALGTPPNDDHVVRLKTDPQKVLDVVLLAPGQRVTFSRRTAPKLDQPTLDAATAWRRGEVMLDKTILPDAIAEMNRYETEQLVIADPRIANLRVSGIYRTGDSEGFARTVAELYDLDVRHEAGQIQLHSR